MFFFIGGLSPATRSLGITKFLCRRCGEKTEKIEIFGSTFSFFLIPLYTWRNESTETILRCRSCGFAEGVYDGSLLEKKVELGDSFCSECHAPRTNIEHVFCPFCGTPFPCSRKNHT